MPTSATPTSWLHKLWSTVLVYFLKFGVIGLLGVFVDAGIFNLLRIEALGVGWWSTALGAKFLSTSIAIIFNWLGNRYWTFRHDRHTHILREFIEFVAASLVGMAVTLGTLWLTHDVFGFTSLLADNISANIIGLGIGTLVRFVLYRFWVWRPRGAASGIPDVKSEVEELSHERG